MTVLSAGRQARACQHGVLIVGAGVGGLALALALHARGMRPVVLEREPALQAVGAGLQLGPNAARVLFALGLEEGARRIAGAARDAQILRGRDGRRLSTTRFSQAEARWGAPYMQALRSDLQALLREAVEARDAAELRLDAPVAAAHPSGVVTLVDGGRLRAEVVVGADGLRSRVADAVPGGSAPRRLRQSAWRALIPAERLPAGVLVPATQVRIGAGGHLVTYPVAGGSLLNLVAVVEDGEGGGDGEESWTARGDPAVLRHAFRDWGEPAPTLLAALEGETVWRGELYDRPPRRRWAQGRVALLGDAAHAMSPSFAQGAGMAIEDAWVLAEALASAPVEEALAAYAQARRGRAARVQGQSRLNARLFHLPDALSTPIFLAAQATGRDGGLARFDWLYGGGPIPAGG